MFLFFVEKTKNMFSGNDKWFLVVFSLVCGFSQWCSKDLWFSFLHCLVIYLVFMVSFFVCFFWFMV